MTKPGAIIWFTGLSGSGKTTIAEALAKKLQAKGVAFEHLDGDVLRSTITSHLGFSTEDRKRNITIAGYIANLLASHGVIVIATFISPIRSQREELKTKYTNFIEVFVNAPLEVCEKRDVKGLYKKARGGEVAQFTGIDNGYEPPLHPDLELDTNKESVEQCVSKVVDLLGQRRLM